MQELGDSSSDEEGESYQAKVPPHRVIERNAEEDDEEPDAPLPGSGQEDGALRSPNLLSQSWFGKEAKFELRKTQDTLCNQETTRE